MAFCKWCSDSPHRVTADHKLECDCGCHQVCVLDEYDKEAWWLPAEEPTMGMSLIIREKPIRGLVLTYYYREPQPLGLLGPWVESSEVQLDLRQVGALKARLQEAW